MLLSPHEGVAAIRMPGGLQELLSSQLGVRSTNKLRYDYLKP